MQYVNFILKDSHVLKILLFNYICVGVCLCMWVCACVSTGARREHRCWILPSWSFRWLWPCVGAWVFWKNRMDASPLSHFSSPIIYAFFKMQNLHLFSKVPAHGRINLKSTLLCFILLFFCSFYIYIYISSHRFSFVFVRFQSVFDNVASKPQVCLHSLFSGLKIAPQNILITLTYFFLFILVDRETVLAIERIQAIQRHD